MSASAQFGSTLTEVYSNAARRYDGMPAFSKEKGGSLGHVTFEGLFERGLDLATALIAMGLEAREHVGLIADNRWEWIVSDYGILLAGAADVPRGSDVTDPELLYILTHSDAKVVFVEGRTLLRRLLDLRQQLPHVQHIILMVSDGDPVDEGVHLLDDLLTQGVHLRASGDHSASDRMRAVKPADLFTIIYTSGTTGTPKGFLSLMRTCVLRSNIFLSPFVLETGRFRFFPSGIAMNVFLRCSAFHVVSQPTTQACAPSERI